MKRFTIGLPRAVSSAFISSIVLAVGCSEEGGASRPRPDAALLDVTQPEAATPVPEAAAEAASPVDGSADAAPDAAQDGTPDGHLSDAAPAGPLLSETGLYAARTQDLAPGVRSFRPRFELWADGATKRRFVYLPPGTQIDTTDVDAWRFPVGTKLWKEFSRDGIRVETRLIEKVAEGSSGWTPMAYAWNTEQTRAVAVPAGVPDALGTQHNVPAQSFCFGCHGGPGDFVLGFSAVQLGWPPRKADGGAAAPGDAGQGDELDLATLVREGWLTVPPAATSYDIPGGPEAVAALGALHASCGHCHRPGTVAWERAQLDLLLRVSELGSLQATAAYRTAVGVAPERIIDGADFRITPGAPERSALYLRMSSRDALLAMPPIATEIVDTEGAAALAAFISRL